VALHTQLVHLIGSYGVWVVGLVIGLESTGIPLPGETTLIAAAVYAGSTERLNIASIIIVAALGAVVGDNVGFWIGRRFGYHWFVRHQSLLHLTPRRLKLGQYLFQRHGGKVVFWGRFVAVLRTLAALLAGINCMDWKRFLLFNAAGGVVWASVYGAAGYMFGRELPELLEKIGAWLGVLAVCLTLAGLWLVRNHEQQWEDEAERALPGPLRS
jgi:membrane protein DedA with SNARE-associated domain